jgi:uncharacterized protein involved in exopolysaccharide biosynthesis
MNNNNKDLSSSEVVKIDDIIEKLVDFFYIIKSKKKLLIITSIFGLFISLLYIQFEKPKYSAVLKFALEEDKGGSSFGGAAGIASQLGIDLGSSGGLFSGSNIIELMKSRFIVEKTLLSKININGKFITYADYFINTNNLRDEYEESKKNLFNNIDINRENFTRQQNEKLSEIYNSLLKENINISQKDKKVSIVSIEVSSFNEYFSKYFCEELASQTSNYYIQIKSGKAKKNVKVLQNQLDSVRYQLNNAIYGVAASSDNVYNLNPSLIKRSTPTRKNQIDVQTNTALLGQLVANLEIAKLTLQKETPLIQVLDTPLFPLDIIKTNKFLLIIFCSIFMPFFTLLIFIISNVFKEKLIKKKNE